MSSFIRFTDSKQRWSLRWDEETQNTSGGAEAEETRTGSFGGKGQEECKCGIILNIHATVHEYAVVFLSPHLIITARLNCKDMSYWICISVNNRTHFLHKSFISNNISDGCG